MKRLGLVINTYNRPEYTKQCFDSVMKYTPPDGSLIVIVDDCSTDKETLRLIKNFDIQNCEVIKLYNKKNRSIKYTLKQGIDKCFENNCHYVSNLDSDAIINSMFYDKLTYLYEFNTGHIITGFNCLTKNSDGRERHKIINDFGFYNTKKSVGGVNMFFTKNEYDKYINPALIECLEKGGNWDHQSCIKSEKDNKPIICSIPSVVQHIGIKSAMGHSIEAPDVADDFQYLYMSNVTLCIADSVNLEKAIKAINYSCKNILFGDIKILTHFKSNDCRVLNIPQIKSITEYNEFIFKKLADYITTDYIMLIQSDGFILNASAWNNDWYNYDYIGATWKWHKENRVGNGGFSFRSLKLHKALQNNEFVLKNDNCNNLAEDHNICCTYKKTLEKKYSINFSPESVADIFSIEAFGRKDRDYNNQFGFHGYELNFKGFNPYEYISKNKKLITVNMATYPTREQSAKKIIQHLVTIDLIDKIRIYLNEYKEVPEWCKHDKIEVAMGENLKDSGKFFWAGQYKNEYYFTIDDDIFYSEGYFKRHISLLESNNKMFISLHGKVLNSIPQSFTDVKEDYHYIRELKNNQWINLPGTGVMVFDLSQHRLPLEMFKYHGMTDLWVAFYLQQNKVPCMIRSHTSDELKYILKDCQTLWDIRAEMKIQHLEILRSVPKWELFKISTNADSDFPECEFLINYNSFKAGRKYRIRKRFVDSFVEKEIVRVL